MKTQDRNPDATIYDSGTSRFYTPAEWNAEQSARNAEHYALTYERVAQQDALADERRKAR